MMWRNRNVWIILAGEFIAGIGLWAGIIGNLEFMQHNVPSDFAKSLILFAGLLAGVLIGPFAGRMIDMYKKKTILIYSSLGRVVSVGFMFLALEYNSIWWMVVFMIVTQLSAAFYFPALQSVIPMVVQEKELLQMNGVHMNIATIARIIGTAAAGALLVIMSLYSLYLASAVAYMLLFFVTFMLHIEEDKKDLSKEKENNQETQQNKGFKEIIPVLKATPMAMMTLVLMLIPVLFIGGFNLMVINISELQNDSTIKGFIYTVEGICFILGAFVVKRISEGRNLMKLLIIFSTMIAIAHLLLYFAEHQVMSLVSFGLFGLAAGCFFPISATIFQTKIPKEYHGRFFSFRGMLDRVLFQVVLLGTGLFLDTIGLKFMVLLFGSLSLCLILYYLMYQLKSVERIEPTQSSEKL